MFSVAELRLHELSEHVVLGYLAIWTLYLLTYRRLDSLILSISISIFASLLMFYLTPYFLSIAKGDGLERKAVWYFGFSAVNLLAIVGISKIHELLKLKVEKLSLVIGGCFFISTVIQVSRFLELLITETDHLSWIYTNGIQFVNLMLLITFVLCMFRGRNLN